MAALNLTIDNFDQEVLNSDKPVLIDFWAPWCGPCQMVLPIIAELAEELTDVKVCKVNVDENIELAQKFRVSHGIIPQFPLWQNISAYGTRLLLHFPCILQSAHG